MTNGLTSRQPAGVLRFLFRLPIWLYRAHLGWIMGRRFLMLTHTGRKSGQPRQVVLEVVAHEKETGAYYVAAGWRGKADWFKNIQANSSMKCIVGNRSFAGSARIVEQTQAASVFSSYARQYPLAFKELTKMMMGEMLQNNTDDCLRLAESVPLVKLTPAQPSEEDNSG